MCTYKASKSTLSVLCGLHGGEISHNNGLLIQIENFEGILLATTNRVDSLNRGVMHRFDLKVEFYH